MTQEPVPDPRPLPDEPLALDLLNTRWLDDGAPYDLLLEPGGLASWLTAVGFDASSPGASRSVRDARALTNSLAELREAIRTHLADPADTAARGIINTALSHGHRVTQLTAAGPSERVDGATGAQRVPWLVAQSYVTLLEGDPTRIRECAHPDCVLYFYDTSRSRNRQWCSMADCGNRAKAARHYARSKEPVAAAE